jgi:tetratricopeptide (TPR) repeat protein
MASRSNQPDEEFSEAHGNWDVETLYIDLVGDSGKPLSRNAKRFLRGVLCGYSPAEIAERCRYRGKNPSDTVRQTLSKEIYPSIKALLERSEDIEWGQVPRLLEGYRKKTKNQLPDESQLAEIMRILQGMQQNERVTISSANLISLPPTLENWQGRTAEIQQLQAWLADTKVKTIGIQGLSGVGKSWLAAYLYESIGFEAKFWADVRQGTDFTVFAQNALMKLAGKPAEELATLQEPEQLIFALLQSLRQRPCLLVVDNLETLLDQERHFLGIYKDFFNRWIEHGTTSTLLLTTQTQPEVMEGHGCWLPLQGLESPEGARLLQELGIVGSDEELQDFSKYLKGHPKMLRLVASKLKRGTHIRKAEEFGFRQLDLLLNKVPMPYRDRERVFFVWILEQHFNNLTPEQQRLFLNLSIYRRSFDRDAAEAVFTDTMLRSRVILWDKVRQMTAEEIAALAPCDWLKITPVGMVLLNFQGNKAEELASNFENQQVLDELTSRSLLDAIQAEQRYQFHPFVWQYAKQKIGTQTEALRERAIAYYLSISTDQSIWQTLEDAAPYLEIVHHLCELKQYVIAFDTLKAIKDFLDLRGYYFAQLELYEQLAQAWEPSEAEKWKFAAAFIDLGNIYEQLGEYPQAIKILQQALVIEREIGNRQGEAAALGNLGITYEHTGQYQQAVECNRQQLAIAREIGDREEEAKALNNLGNVCYWLGQFQESIDYQRQKVKVLQNIGDYRDEAITLGNLGIAYRALGEYQKAIECHEQQLKIARGIGYRSVEARALDGLGVAYNCLEQYQQGIECFQQSLVIAREINDRGVEVISLTNLGNAYSLLGQQQLRQAIQPYQQAIQIAEQIGNYHTQANAWFNYGNALAALLGKSEAITAYQNARTLFQAMGLDEHVQRANEAIERLS